jgi:hypothetical protein
MTTRQTYYDVSDILGKEKHVGTVSRSDKMYKNAKIYQVSGLYENCHTVLPIWRLVFSVQSSSMKNVRIEDFIGIETLCLLDIAYKKDELLKVIFEFGQQNLLLMPRSYDYEEENRAFPGTDLER